MYLLSTYCDPSSGFITGVVAPIVFTSFALMVFMLALFYMAANFFRKSEYESYVSIEMHQLLVSLLIFITIFGATCFASGLSDRFAGDDSFGIAREYLNTISNKVALPEIIRLEKQKIGAQIMGSLSMRWGLAIWGTTMPTFPAFVLVERVIEFLLMLMTPFVASLMVQQVGLEIIRATAIPFVLPAGVVLRIFPPTRDAGAFLIVASIAFGIIFPFTYVMHSAIVYRMLQFDAGSTESAQSLLGTTYPNLIYSVNEGGMWDADGGLLSPMRTLSYLLLQAVFLPALSMSLTIAFIKGTLKFMSQKFD